VGVEEGVAATGGEEEEEEEEEEGEGAWEAFVIFPATFLILMLQCFSKSYPEG